MGSEEQQPTSSSSGVGVCSDNGAGTVNENGNTTVPSSGVVEGICSSEAFLRGRGMLNEENYDEAIEYFGNMLLQSVGQHGETALESAPWYYQYGNALLTKAEECGAQNVFGEGIETAEEARAAADEAAADALRNAMMAAATGGDAGGSSTSSSAVGEQEEEEQQGAQAAAASSEDDVEIAWENLEVARVCFTERGAGGSCLPTFEKLELAKVYLRLGDVGQLQGRFDQAISDYNECLQLREACVSDTGDRRLADCHYCLAQSHIYASTEDQGANLEQHRADALRHFRSSAACFRAQIRQLQGRQVADNEGGNAVAAAAAAAVVVGKGKGKAAAVPVAAVDSNEQVLLNSAPAAREEDAKKLEDLQGILVELDETIVAHQEEDAEKLRAACGQAGTAAAAEGSSVTTFGFGDPAPGGATTAFGAPSSAAATTLGGASGAGCGVNTLNVMSVKTKRKQPSSAAATTATGEDDSAKRAKSSAVP